MLVLIYLLCFLLQFTCSAINKGLKISSGLEEVSRDSVAMRFYIQINNTGNECYVECIPGRCCLEQGEEENCDVLQMIGACSENIPAGKSRMVRLAAPLLDPFDRRGYCTVHLHSKRKGHTMYRDKVTIPFDTGIDPGITPCPKIDQDPLNNCQPVDCDTYYNGNKPYFSETRKRCLKTPPCPADLMLNVQRNKCVKQISGEDIKHIKSLVRKKRNRKDFIVKRTALNKRTKSVQSANETASDMKAKKTLRSVICVVNSSWTSTQVLACIIIAQCCVVFSLVYYVIKYCEKGKDVVSRFFNYEQPETDSTPLINSSNGTATTYQCHDSSSNVDMKIKCYKACQRDQAKSSMSDDILSRCVKRRDWITKPKSSDVIPEFREKHDYGVQVAETEHRNFQTSIGKKCPYVKTERDFVGVSNAMSSEREINVINYQAKIESRATIGAQASFSKDSIDNFLAERGMLILPDENASNSTSLSSSDFNLVSESSKTSKNAVTVLQYLMHKKGPSSDPGGGDTLELLHMSRASMFSSSNPSEYADMKKAKDSRTSI